MLGERALDSLLGPSSSNTPERLMSVSTEEIDASERFLFTEGGRGKAGWLPHPTGSDPDPCAPGATANDDDDDDDDDDATPAAPLPPPFPLADAIDIAIPPARGEESDIVPRERVTAVGEGAEGVWDETRAERWTGVPAFRTSSRV